MSGRDVGLNGFSDDGEVQILVVGKPDLNCVD